MNNVCLICGEKNNSGDYHTKCTKLFYGISLPPSINMSLDNLQEHAAKAVLSRISVTGVQKKLSLGIEHRGKESRFTVVGLWGNYILKPPAEEYPFLPENEFTIMKLAGCFNIPVVPFALIRLDSGELSYICKRIDRVLDKKKAMEDFCQISGRLTEDKYRGSVEKVGKLLQKYSAYPGLDSIDFFERIIFNFLIGNADMHLKNYSLIETDNGMRLSPSYDLLSTYLAIPEDKEESALTINGKKARLSIDDFKALAETISIAPLTFKKTIANFCKRTSNAVNIIEKSLLPDMLKDSLMSLFIKRIKEISSENVH
jgi:serine/threonine-protein kinase HipA